LPRLAATGSGTIPDAGSAPFDALSDAKGGRSGARAGDVGDKKPEGVVRLSARDPFRGGTPEQGPGRLCSKNPEG